MPFFPARFLVESFLREVIGISRLSLLRSTTLKLEQTVMYACLAGLIMHQEDAFIDCGCRRTNSTFPLLAKAPNQTA
jgi:hypothetical protein